MLTVKVMSQNGGEEIHCGRSIGYHPEQRQIATSARMGKSSEDGHRLCNQPERSKIYLFIGPIIVRKTFEFRKAKVQW